MSFLGAVPPKADIGLIGLGVIAANLALSLDELGAHRHVRVVGWHTFAKDRQPRDEMGQADGQSSLKTHSASHRRMTAS